MSENTALSEHEEQEATAISPPGWHINFARFLSTAFSPVTISLPFLLLVTVAIHAPNAFVLAMVTLCFLSVGPALYIGVGVALGKLSDVDVSVRSQRTGPYLFSAGSCVIGFVVLTLVHAPRGMQTILLLNAISSVVLMLITLRWKISMHASSLAAVITMLNMLYGRIVLPAFLLLILVSWSRVVLKRHTIGQVAAGSLFGMVLTWTLVTLRGF
jgi:membrane-associated phospholipid phosphatase